MFHAIVLVCLLYQFTKNSGLLNVLILKLDLKLVCFLSLLLSLSLLKVLTPIFSCLFQIFQKPTASQTHFGFTNMCSNMNRFSATAILSITILLYKIQLWTHGTFISFLFSVTSLKIFSLLVGDPSSDFGIRKI